MHLIYYNIYYNNIIIIQSIKLNTFYMKSVINYVYTLYFFAK